jgi:hypothetical protein
MDSFVRSFVHSFVRSYSKFVRWGGPTRTVRYVMTLFFGCLEGG